jgi:hypothetical protein
LQTGSRYHGYKERGAQPSLLYQVVDRLEFQSPLPTRPQVDGNAPMTDYNAIMKEIGIGQWVKQRGVREVWLWSYLGGKVGAWESNMAGPHGDISNSDRTLADLPMLDQTYTVYHCNYARNVSDAVEAHMHQIEALLRHVDSRLFWDLFVGGDKGKRCGWAHYPPNAKTDYDWANPTYVQSDIEDWRPEGKGTLQRINCERWNGDSLGWFVYWMQNVPGADNGLTYRGRALTNWWTFIGDFDRAMASRLGLTE